MEPHYHWRFFAYNESQVLNRETGQVNNMVTVDVAGWKDEDSAKNAAKNIIERETWHLHSIWECRSCGISERLTSSLEKMYHENTNKD